ncbi:MAG: glycosyltransferase [Pseudomonadota bacterium]
MSRVVLFHVVHLLGHGHIHRARNLVKAMKAEGLTVHIAHGGMSVEGFDYGADSVTYLPPLRAEDATYAKVLNGDGAPVTNDDKAERERQLLALFQRVRPDVVLMEAWPFGRRVVRGELTALCTAAREAGAACITSVRDILQEGRKPGRNEETRDAVRDHIDTVLVHSDPALITLDATFPFAPQIADKLHYTGFVVADVPTATDAQTYDTIVTAGGGAFGDTLVRTAREVASDADEAQRDWCIVDRGGVLGNNPLASPGLTNLAAHLARARLSISQCGYNTAMDVLAARCRAVFVPHDTTGQTEQLRRASLLAEKGYGVCLPESELTRSRLQDAICHAREMSIPGHRPGLDGATRAARIIASARPANTPARLQSPAIP